MSGNIYEELRELSRKCVSLPNTIKQKTKQTKLKDYGR